MKKFENPEINVDKFAAEDIIATSGGGLGGDGNTGGDGGNRQ